MKFNKTEMTKTTLRVPKQLLDACKHRAIDENRNLQDLVSDALEAYLKTKIKRIKKEG